MTLTNSYAQLDLIAVPLFVLEVTDDGLPVYAAFNTAARAISQRPLSDYLGRTATDVYAAAHGRTAFARHCLVVDTGEPLSYELQLPLAGSLRTISTTLRPELDAAGHVVRIFATSVDITVENAAREAKVTLQTAATEMEQFVAMAAHDLRAPMRNVTMLAQILKEDFVDHGDGKLDLINMMDEVAEKTMGLINDVLSHAQAIEVTHSESEFELTDLASTICNVIDPEERHRFTVTPATLITDKTSLQVTLRNLIDNAVKHAQTQTLCIDIAVAAAENGMIEVTLQDNGKGFTQAGLQLMNGGTFRVDSGYGLFGVRRIIRARGGVMRAENSSKTGGAVIRFTVPGQLIRRNTAKAAPRQKGADFRIGPKQQLNSA